MPKLEIVIETVEDALAAKEGGADSIEIALDLQADGLTPPLDLAKAVRDAVDIEVHAILRAHNRGFVYEPVDIDKMFMQAKAFAAIEVTSVVFGAHTTEQHFDVELVKRFAAEIAPTPITTHRALDWSVNAEQALEQLVGVVPRVLSSGGQRSTWDGRDTLRAWVEHFGEHFEFVAGGGIKLEHVRALADDVKPDVIHVASAVRTDNKVDARKVAQFVDILR